MQRQSEANSVCPRDAIRYGILSEKLNTKDEEELIWKWIHYS